MRPLDGFFLCLLLATGNPLALAASEPVSPGADSAQPMPMSTKASCIACNQGRTAMSSSAAASLIRAFGLPAGSQRWAPPSCASTFATTTTNDPGENQWSPP